MVALLNTAFAIAHVVVYQDSEDSQTFFYVPTQVEGRLGETLEAFKVTYWGYGKPFFRQHNGQVSSVFGLVIAGQATLEISAQQRQQLIEQIQKQFDIQAPNLVPLLLRFITAEPKLGSNPLVLGATADLNLPETIEVGTAFSFLVGTGNQPFPQWVRSQPQKPQLEESPVFGLQIIGQTEVQAEPWEVEVEANLSKLWSSVRKRASAEVSAGWLELKLTEYDKLIQELLRDHVIKLSPKVGKLEVETSASQRFEIGKHIFSALPLNCIQFRPNPDGQYSVWLNLIYGEKAITPTLHQSTFIRQDRVLYPVPIYLSLNVKCDAKTREHFQDLGNPNEPCITAAKVEEMRKRLKDERTKQTQFARNLYSRLVSGEITLEQYNRAISPSTA